ncbi:lysozyme inhibitor LprI family protein [Paracoccus sp. YLB-12]|uniref:Lysozyme inhibitor LprI family protein n=2 Tax=Paracoccus maritimus TaxID=2933292 RepID=A0ABT2K7L7_9RHOB|nr:lysozyme inhibitor LprI family protein [Paracoccus sp. YLB-12]
MMRAFLMAVMMLLPSGAMAQDDMIDASAVEACFAQSDPSSAACIGDAADTCQTTQPQGQTTVGISECAMAEHAVWDDILNREYGNLRDAFSDRPALAKQLLSAQRAWILFRDADCGLAYDRYDGGSMRVIAAAYCKLQHTARRALDLRDMQGG